MAKSEKNRRSENGLGKAKGVGTGVLLGVSVWVVLLFVVLLYLILS